MSSDISGKMTVALSPLARGGEPVIADRRNAIAAKNSSEPPSELTTLTLNRSVEQTIRDEAKQAEGEDANAPISGEELMEAVSDMNQHFQNVQRNLHFSVDEDNGSTIVRVIEAETEEVIRQIPSEEVLQLRKRLEENIGRIIQEKA